MHYICSGSTLLLASVACWWGKLTLQIRMMPWVLLSFHAYHIITWAHQVSCSETF